MKPFRLLSIFLSVLLIFVMLMFLFQKDFLYLLLKDNDKDGKKVNISEILNSNTNFVTEQGIGYFTNKSRIEAGLNPLSENELLRQAAQSKISDMVNENYFNHESPSGKVPADFVISSGYKYLMVGENLASGNFENDDELVAGWLNSPGHRANILNEDFTEIGIATKQVTVNGSNVWYAVQIFATPITVCPSVNSDELKKIESSRVQLLNIKSSLEKQKATLSTIDPKISSEDRKKMVNNYNLEVIKYNNLLTQIKKEIDQYNELAKKFNKCLENAK